MPPPAEQSNWVVVLYFWLWRLLTLPVLGLIYWVVNAHGLRMQLAIFGTKLWKLPIPGFSYLRHFHGVADLDIGHAFAIFLMFIVLLLARYIVDLLILRRERGGRSVEALKASDWLIVIVGVVIILGDCCIFFAGLSNHVDSMWGGETRFLVPSIATAMYLSVILFVGFMDCKLEADLQKHNYYRGETQ